MLIYRIWFKKLLLEKKTKMNFIVSLLAGFLVFFSGVGKSAELKELCSQSDEMGNRVNNYIYVT